MHDFGFFYRSKALICPSEQLRLAIHLYCALACDTLMGGLNDKENQAPKKAGPDNRNQRIHPYQKEGNDDRHYNIRNQAQQRQYDCAENHHSAAVYISEEQTCIVVEREKVGA